MKPRPLRGHTRLEHAEDRTLLGGVRVPSGCSPWIVPCMFLPINSSAGQPSMATAAGFTNVTVPLRSIVLSPLGQGLGDRARESRSTERCSARRTAAGDVLNDGHAEDRPIASVRAGSIETAPPLLG